MTTNRKRDILIAAGNCFVKYGYEKTTLDDIAEQVGINKASFYYYFKNKEAIFIELIIQEADEYINLTKKKVESIDDCKIQILTWIRESFKYNQTNSILHQLSVESLKKLTPQLIKLKNYSKEQGIDFLIEILSNYKRKGKINTDNVNKLAHTIQNVIYALKDQAYQNIKSIADDNINNLIEEIIYTVSIILNGVIVQ